MKILSSLDLPSVSKHCLCSDLTTWLVYLFLGSNTGLWSLLCSVCSQHLFCVIIFFQLADSYLVLDYTTSSFSLQDCSQPRSVCWFFSPIYNWVTQLKRSCGWKFEWKQERGSICCLGEDRWSHILACYKELIIISLLWMYLQLIHFLL